MSFFRFSESPEEYECVSTILNFAAFEGVDGRESFDVSVLTVSFQRLISDSCWANGMVGVVTSCREDSPQEVSDVATDDLDLTEAENMLEVRDISDATEDRNKLLLWEIRSFVRSGKESSHCSPASFCCGLELFTTMLFLRALFRVCDAEISTVNVAVVGVLFVVLFGPSFKSLFRRKRRTRRFNGWLFLSSDKGLSFTSSLAELKYEDRLRGDDICFVSAAVCPGSGNVSITSQSIEDLQCRPGGV